MKKTFATVQSLRIAPRKVRVVADLIKGKGIYDADQILSFTSRRAARHLRKLLVSARANAAHNSKISDEGSLFIKDIRVDEGMVFKRFMPRARGRASAIRKRTSNITIVLDTKR